MPLHHSAMLGLLWTVSTKQHPCRHHGARLRTRRALVAAIPAPVIQNGIATGTANRVFGKMAKFDVARRAGTVGEAPVANLASVRKKRA